MCRLHIEHPITDYGTWRDAFDRFTDMRVASGVIGTQLARPVDDDRFIVIDLDFESPAAASTFLTFLEQQIWSTPQSSPGLGGQPRTMILDDID